MSAESPTNKEKERISNHAHAACEQVLGHLLGHASLRNPDLSSWGKTALLEGTFLDVEALPSDVKAKLTRKCMGLDVVQKMLGSKPSRCRFKTVDKFSKDVRFVFQNILAWQAYVKQHQPSAYDELLQQTAQRLLQGFDMMYKGELARHASGAQQQQQGAPPPPSESPPPPPPPAASPTPTPTNGQTPRLNESDTQKCLGIVQRIIKHKEHGLPVAAPFLHPVDLTMYVDYKVKIPHRMHLFGVQQKLSNAAYVKLEDFAHDMRLIFANCLVYNSEVFLSVKIRDHAVKLMHLFEDLMNQTFDQGGNTWHGMPQPDRWKCHDIIHNILAHRTDGVETAQWFKHPIATYYASADQAPYNYFKVIKRPMDIGTVTSRLHLGEYTEVASAVKDLRLVFDNCIKYWKGHPDGQIYRDAAKALLSMLQSNVLSAFGPTYSGLFEKSSKSKSSSSTPAPEAGKSSATTPVHKESKKSSSRREFAEKDNCMKILELIRQHKMKGVMGEILTAGPFLHAVDITKYPDYAQIVTEPMDFNKIERKLKSNRYSSVSEFSADVHLIFSNCMKYNSDPVEGADIRTMATNLRDYFVSLYKELESGRDIVVTKPPPTVVLTKPKKTSSEPVAPPPAPPAIVLTIAATTLDSSSDKKHKKEKKKKKDKKKEKKEKKKHKHHHEDAPVAPPPPPPAAVVDLTSPSKVSSRKSTSSSSKPSKHKVKLDLAPWEATCERLVSRILKLEFVAAMHFEAPLAEKLPDLAKIYREIIPEPMDLGTLRNKLIAHEIPDQVEFVRLGRLIFDNAKTFNAGPDAASIRVRETADHLRWLFDSLCVEACVIDDADARKQWRNDRFTAVQTLKFVENRPNKECLKVLKSLTSQKHVKDTWPFLEPAATLFKDLPPTYFEIVKQPMDLKTIAEKLNALTYKSYGDFIADVRLTFENAMLYNQLDKDKEGWTIYGAAKKLYELSTELWGDVTIDVVERVRRSVMEHKEAQVEMEKSRAAAEARAVIEEAERIKEYQAKLEQQKKDEAEAEERAAAERAAREKLAKEARSKEMLASLSKSERKLEERRRKRLKKEEEAAQKEKRSRTAAMATEDALREAEHRSRLRKKALEIQKQREARELQARLDMQNVVRKPLDKRKPPPTSNGTFWKIKRRKVAEPAIFVDDDQN
ncbi:unnamed protein product [Aphanomyces euteiches]|uniref:Bromo domain-containing protein n=1 Tax=Aphanomyces euteiches TaxID=100861 RepID=A0A6G0WNK6_9STRA|nr:hypothetical protein Ae201684_013258 [Aphanomyces euteiches]KAH9064837.1 hypothetical protein Ae201684P_003618 [Aphanomyces euteiches]KAH9156689.1 hypothetical protein AeRB84_001424 [Aphanomyces euteiches]